MNPFRNCKIVGTNISPEVYLRQDPKAERGNSLYVLSRSDLMKFLPCHRKWKNGIPEKDSTSLEWGNLVDCAILQPSSFEQRYCVAPEMYPRTPTKADPRTEGKWTRAATYCNEWEAEKKKDGFEVIKKDEFDEVKGALTVFYKNEFAVAFTRASLRQVFIIGEYFDEATGVIIPVKCLLDLQPDKALIETLEPRRTSWLRYLGDYKSGKSAAPKAFESSIFEYGYDVQAYMSLQMFNNATGEHRDSWQFLVQENNEPYEMPDVQPAIYDGGSFMELGQARCLHALRSYAQCVKTGKWPSYALGGRTRVNNDAYVAEAAEWMDRDFLDNTKTIEESLQESKPVIHEFDTPP